MMNPTRQPEPKKSATQPAHRWAGVCLGTVALAAALIGAAALAPLLHRAREYRPAFETSELTGRTVAASPFAQIMGEIRTSAADLMWIKTDRYLHRGVAYEAHIIDPLAEQVEHEGEHEDGEKIVYEHEHDQGEEHHNHPPLATLIPAAHGDYRGFIGTLQRHVQPWNQPGAPDEHTSGDQLLPWYRLLTLSDPHHWRGYAIGAWWLSKQATGSAAAEAEAFIGEGIRNNPEIFQLRLMQGRIFIVQENWRAAIGSFQAATRLALKVRPPDGKQKLPDWTLDDEDDFAMAARYVPLIQWRKLNDPEAAKRSLAEALTWLPGDAPLSTLAAELERVTVPAPAVSLSGE